jgi:hypothetical protein
MKFCHICNDTENITDWRHPVSGDGYMFCSYCFNTVIGVCPECNAILSKLDPIGINSNGEKICYKCSAVHDMAED